MSHPHFEPVPQPFDFDQAERNIIDFWQEHQVYEQSLKARAGAEPFVFFEGPPTANGTPHPGHCLTRTIKDIFPRYKSMCGYLCERKAGWDTHGLPVEVEVCKELGILEGGKQAIEELGIAKFNEACMQSVFRYKGDWEKLTERIGFWVDLDDAYVTFHQSYVESVWWALKQLFDRGLLYQGYKVVWWWAQGGTALSAGEVAEGYRDTDDPAITVRLRLTAESKAKLGLADAASLLVWTTTPWTLSSNCAAAVGAELEYAIVQHEGEQLIVAQALVEKNFGEGAEVVKTLSGSALVGLHYEPIFRYDTPGPIEGGHGASTYWVVTAADFVELGMGTGIVHLAPAFGEDDYRICRDQGIGFLCFVRPDGTFDERVTDVDPYDQTPIAGQFCKAADKAITRLLKLNGALFKHEQFRHSYPFCPRADQDPLIQYARRSWFIRTSQFKGDFLANNAQIGWQPEHIRDGRFGNFLENNVDWALSRERYWGTPLPVWICEQTGHMECLSTYEELLAKPDVRGTEAWAEAKAANPELNENLKVHKPYIDAITYQSPKAAGARMRRVTEVIDVWFDAGSMPFAQWGYPHQAGSAEAFDSHFPADFISEGIDQTRGWFYALLSISTMLFEKEGYPHPFENCICLGMVLGEDGTKLSKRLKNYEDPDVLFRKYSADAVRWSLVSKSPPTTSGYFTDKNVQESQRELLMRWYNVWSFFVIYANLDGFDPSHAPVSILREAAGDPVGVSSGGDGGASKYRAQAERSELDRWILSEVDRTALEVREHLDRYDTYPAARSVTALVDALSNWYVRRSRPRFWASGWTPDKADAYWTLYEVLLKVARLAAPFTPFFAEITWRSLTKPLPGAAKSVHLTRYPEANAARVDHELLEQMKLTRETVTLGLSARRSVNIKVRQPLSGCQLVVTDSKHRTRLERHIDLLKEELNIKEIGFSERPEEYVSYEVRPNFKVLGPKFGKRVQAITKTLAKGEGAVFYQQLQEGTLALEIEGERIELTGDDVEVRLNAKDGFAAAPGRHVVVIISTEITQELREEGWARDVIRQLQEARKELNLPYDARIHVTYHTDDVEMAAGLGRFGAMVAGEVLAVEFLPAGPGDGKRVVIDGKEVELVVVQAPTAD